MSEIPVQGEQDLSAGALLRQAREKSGLHIAALAVSIRVPVKKLEALEADRLDLLPDAVFARALTSSICRALKIDPKPILIRLPQTEAPRLWSDSAGMNVPFSSPRDNVNPSFWNQFPKPVLGAVLLLLIGTLVLVFYPDTPEREGQTKLVSSEVVSQAAVSAAVPPPVVSPVTLPRAAPTPPVAAVVAPVPVPVPAVRPITSDVLAFKTKDASWVEVTDAQGVSQFRRIVAPGETVGVSGALPLSVVIGRADVTEVWVRGKAFTLDGIARENVARFEVK